MTSSEQSARDVPNSPIVGRADGFGIPASTGKEHRRARAVVEVFYECDEDEFVDIQAQIWDALDEQFSSALFGVDLTEHVVLVDGPDARAVAHE